MGSRDPGPTRCKTVPAPESEVSRPASRARRWLYHGLHNLDFNVRNPGGTPWYTLVIVLMSGGGVLSITSLWLTLRYFWRKRARDRPGGGRS